ncbi:MAG: hypothetical protein QM757_00475 [Paludibaculum sp.]
MSNKFMVDVKRPAREVIAAMAQQKVFVGRAWPIWPTHVRVTGGHQGRDGEIQNSLRTGHGVGSFTLRTHFERSELFVCLIRLIN